MIGLTLTDVLIGLGGILVVVAIVMVTRHRSAPTHPRSASHAGHEIEAEEELNLLKSGSLWGDVQQPRLAEGRRGRRRS